MGQEHAQLSFPVTIFYSFRIEWGSTRSDQGDYVLRCMLPGLKEFFRVKDNDSGKIEAEKLLKYWIEKAEIK